MPGHGHKNHVLSLTNWKWEVTCHMHMWSQDQGLFTFGH